MTDAKRVRTHVPQWSDRLEAAKAKKAHRVGSFSGKTFEGLTPEDKDALLKAVAIQLNLIEPS